MNIHSFTVFGIPATCWLINPETVGWLMPRPNRPYGDYCDPHGNTWDEMPLADFVGAFGMIESNGKTLTTLLAV